MLSHWCQSRLQPSSSPGNTGWSSPSSGLGWGSDGRAETAPDWDTGWDVRQLLLNFILDLFSRIFLSPVPRTRGRHHNLLPAHAHRMLIGARNPGLYPIHVLRPQSRSRRPTRWPRAAWYGNFDIILGPVSLIATPNRPFLIPISCMAVEQP